MPPPAAPGYGFAPPVQYAPPAPNAYYMPPPAAPVYNAPPIGYSSPNYTPPPAYVPPAPINVAPQGQIKLGYEAPPPQPMTQPNPHKHEVYVASEQIIIATTGGSVINTQNNMPMAIRCYACNQNVVTRVEKKAGGCTYITCILCCLVLGPFGLCAFCMDNVQDCNHHCSNCDALVAIRKGSC